MAETHQLPTSSLNPKSSSFTKLNQIAEQNAKDCNSASMPTLDHLSMSDYDVVYEPSDDTYLLIDGIGFEVDRFLNSEKAEEQEGMGVLRKNPLEIQNTLEIGCGTGVATVYLAKRLIDEGKKFKKKQQTHLHRHYVTDINKEAIRITLQTAQENNIPSNIMTAHTCDLASDLLPQFAHSIDVLIFNPPYVPTPDDEVVNPNDNSSNDETEVGIEASWAGGTNGRLVIDRALPQIAQLLSWPNGVAYMITVDDNLPEDIAEIMWRDYGVKVVPLVRRKARNEYLSVVKMTLTRKLV